MIFLFLRKNNEHIFKFIFSTGRVATVREKYLENEIFPGQGKSGNFVDGQGNLERSWKVREKSGNL